MTLTFIKLTLVICVYSLLFFLEHLKPYFKERKAHISHSIRNLSLATTNTILGAGLFVLFIHQTFLFTEKHQLGLLNYLTINDIWKLITAIILIDLWQYCWHRLNHSLPFLWRFHRVHHSDKELDASSGVRFHPGEIFLSTLARLLVIPLLGIQLSHLISYEIIMMSIVFFHHSNIRLNESSDQLLRKLIVTPHMHRLHHSDQQTETDSNYGNIFSVWDKFFRTYTMRSIENNFSFGLGNDFKNEEWNSYTGMLKIPLKDTAKLT